MPYGHRTDGYGLSPKNGEQIVPVFCSTHFLWKKMLVKCFVIMYNEAIF